MKWPVIVVSLFTVVAMAACKQRYRPATTGEVKATFVMSDTMLHHITVDTAICAPVMNVLQLHGTVISVKKAQATVVAHIPATDLSKLKQGMTIAVTTDFIPQHTYTGHISRLSTNAVQVIISLLSGEPPLQQATPATFQLQWPDSNHMIAIPASAVIYDKHKKKSFVMVFRDRFNIDKRQVWTFKSLDNTSYISSGLDEGEKVVSTDQQYIYDAMSR
ncbi:hypothetical protein GA0116948_11467 [Chitinophaga costaii]|uniref:HlyD family secretion protein n=1 Tax=Chitinophaga costaii TaxID=1335309 RepID=A0A1C4FHT6_9BACT|nr:hypothetical protein [Chitinophaga costaii]PUZ20283.1 hypothetical protein DCM91_19120 [Chitinophaga costaii]SCC55412.1 hypothetical protein GA0116948_11467 [Chitinophaga costaii]